MTTAIAARLESQRAPTAGQIIADASLATEYEVPYFGMTGEFNRFHYDPSDPTVVETTELQAFQDLGRFSEEVESVSGIAAHGMFVDTLQVLGRNHLEIAADAIAEEWDRSLQSSRRGEIVAGVNPGNSSLLVYGAVLRALERRANGLSAAVKPLDITQLSGVGSRLDKRRMRDALREGIEIVDDYLITGRQLRNTHNALVNYGVNPETVRSRFVSIADQRHTSTIVPGIPEPEGVFSHRVFSHGDPSITTTWSPSDFGFRHVVARLLEAAGSPIGSAESSIAPPLLFSPVREYRLQKGLAGQPLPSELQARVDAVEAIRKQAWLQPLDR